MFNRILKLPLAGDNSFFLLGPWAVGKTSYISHYLNASLYLDLLDFATYSILLANPSRLETFIPPLYNGWIIVDEVQRIPELLQEVHRLIENKKYKFILVASSMRNLLKADTAILVEKLPRYKMHPLIIQEINDKFSIDQVVLYGLLPSVIGNADPKKYLENYVESRIHTEIVQEGLIRSIGAFARFLEIASFSQGQILNISEIAREISVHRLMVANYFDILEDLLLSSRITPFVYGAKRKIIAHHKFYFFDVGVYKALRAADFLGEQESARPALETLFFQSLSAVNDYYDLGYKIHFWRTQTGEEVDFILYGPRGLHAFEIKRSAQITSKSLKGLKVFSEDYPEAKLHILFFGKQKEYHGIIQAIPFEEALRDLPQLIG